VPLTASASVVVPATWQLPDNGNPAGHAAVPQAGRAVSTAHPNQVIGTGTPAGCTSAAVVKAVARGGVITFNCGPDPVVIKMTATAKLRNTSHRPVYITQDTFTGGRCSNGGALSSIQVSWVVTNSVMTNNRAIGFGQNPAQPGTAGGGSGGAIYNDGDRYSLKIAGTVIRDNHAREGGGAIFFVSNNYTGWLTIRNSTLHNNPSAVFWTRPYPGIFFHSTGHPRIINSKLS
jgi:hypothetical protein